MSSSCSEIAKNMQFPSPWLSDISKPLSWAIFFKFSEGSVFPAFPFASISRICRRSSWMAPPVNEKRSNNIHCESKKMPVSYRFNTSKQVFMPFYFITLASKKRNQIWLSHRRHNKNHLRHCTTLLRKGSCWALQWHQRSREGRWEEGKEPPIVLRALSFLHSPQPP